ncbi:hypothetical protein GH733_015111, partial [Mirounga leonina]
MDFPTPPVAFYSLLEKQIFRIKGVKAFMAFTNESEDVGWNLMKPDIYATVLDFLHLVSEEGSLGEVGSGNKTKHEVMATIREVISGGSEEGIVIADMLRFFTRCPGPNITLRNGIQNMIQQ